MDLQAFTNSRYGVALALFLARSLPPRAGYWVGRRLANLIYAFRRSALVQAVRVNQYVVSGGTLRGQALEARVQQVLHHGARCAYDFYHTLGDPEATLSLIRMGDACRELIERSQRGTEGMVVVGPHLSNFDLGMQALGHAGLKAQVLAIATPTSGYEWQNEFRQAAGLEVTPIRTSTLLQAMYRLREGGIVVTGVDRPVPGKKETLTFFGRPAALPVGHVRMAMDAKVPVQVVSVHMDEEGIYHLDLSDPIPMQYTGNRKADIRANAQRVIAVVEEHIRRAPHQWLMYYPVWPDALAELEVEA